MSLRFYLAAVIRAFQVNRHAFLFHRQDLITTALITVVLRVLLPIFTPGTIRIIRPLLIHINGFNLVLLYCRAPPVFFTFGFSTTAIRLYSGNVSTLHTVY